MNRPRRLWIIAAAALLLAAGVFAVVRHRAAQERRAAMAGLPARPDLQGWPDGLAREVAAQEAALTGGGDPVAALGQLAALYHANGFYPEALHAYATLRTLEPDEPRWAHRAAHLHAAFGEHDQAIPLWREVSRRAPEYLPAQIGLGEALFKSGELDQAASVFTSVLQREPDNVYAQLGLARIDVARGQWTGARDRLERIASQTQGLLGADLLATAYEQTGAPARGAALRAQQKSHGMYVAMADPWIDELMEHCFDSYRLALESGTAGIRRDFDRAERLLERARRIDPNNANVHFHAGVLAEQRGDARAARERLERAVRLDPQLTDAWAALVRVQESAGQAQNAWRTLSEALAANPDSPVLLLERGRRLKAQGRTEAAIADFRRVTRLRRDEALAFIELASLLFNQDQVDEGIATLEQGLAAEPGHPIALSILMFASVHAGRREDADRWWREIQFQPRVSATERARLQQAYQEKFGVPPPRIDA